jgi:hypothetical protein
MQRRVVWTLDADVNEIPSDQLGSLHYRHNLRESVANSRHEISVHIRNGYPPLGAATEGKSHSAPRRSARSSVQCPELLGRIHESFESFFWADGRGGILLLRYRPQKMTYEMHGMSATTRMPQ